MNIAHHFREHNMLNFCLQFHLSLQMEMRYIDLDRCIGRLILT